MILSKGTSHMSCPMPIWFTNIISDKLRWMPDIKLTDICANHERYDEHLVHVSLGTTSTFALDTYHSYSHGRIVMTPGTTKKR